MKDRGYWFDSTISVEWQFERAIKRGASFLDLIYYRLTFFYLVISFPHGAPNKVSHNRRENEGSKGKTSSVCPNSSVGLQSTISVLLLTQHRAKALRSAQNRRAYECRTGLAKPSLRLPIIPRWVRELAAHPLPKSSHLFSIYFRSKDDIPEDDDLAVWERPPPTRSNVVYWIVG